MKAPSLGKPIPVRYLILLGVVVFGCVWYGLVSGRLAAYEQSQNRERKLRYEFEHAVALARNLKE
jgi:Tfp pilus assembly protein PilO